MMFWGLELVGFLDCFGFGFALFAVLFWVGFGGCLRSNLSWFAADFVFCRGFCLVCFALCLFALLWGALLDYCFECFGAWLVVGFGTSDLDFGEGLV